MEEKRETPGASGVAVGLIQVRSQWRSENICGRCACMCFAVVVVLPLYIYTNTFLFMEEVRE